MSEKLLHRVIPRLETIVISANSQLLQKMITTQLAALTEKTPTELGYQGSAAWYSRKENSRIIVSRFDYDKVIRKGNNRFGSDTTFIPELEKLNTFFFYGELANYVYDEDEDNNYVVFKWHAPILLSYLTNTSLLDESFRIYHKEITKSDKKGKKEDKNKKDDHSPMMLFIERSYRNTETDQSRYSSFDPEEIPEYFNRFI